MGTKGELYFPINTHITDPSQGTVYTLKKLIGRGAYAQCFLATIETNEPFALKIIRLKDLKSKTVLQKLQTEISIHSSLDHPNIVKMYTSFRDSEYVFMVLELCERGGLDDLLKRNGKLKERYVSKFMSQLVKGLIYLHETMSVVHRDLKLGNLFLDNQLNIKIGDFGLSAIIKDGEKRKTVCGTPNYIAPEVLFGKASGHSFEADIWSVGVIIYTLLVGTPPFQQKSVEEIYKLIELNKYIFPPDCELSSEAIDLITKILNSNPAERPDLPQILAHKFLSQKENLANRVYKNLATDSYKIGPFEEEHVVYSIPINSIKGIGYILKSGICGVYYQDMANAYLRQNSLIFIKLKQESSRKIFVTEEHLIDNIPNTLMEYHKNIAYFISNYTSYGFKSSFYPSKENQCNSLVGRSDTYTTSTASLCPGVFNRALINSNVFVAKVKKIKDGLLFVMTNNVFVFDFNDGSKVVIGKDGTCVHTFNDDGPIRFADTLKNACLAVLRLYCTTK